MAESSLSITYDDLRTAVGFYIGYKRSDKDEWSDEQNSIVDEIINSGLRQFYYPPLLDDQLQPHEWSFLKPVETLTTVSGTGDYDLPDDYGGYEGRWTFASNLNYPDIDIISESQIRTMRNMNDSSGVPRYAAIRPKEMTSGTEGQRFEVMLYPEPAAAYVISYRKVIRYNILSDTNQYPAGGTEHGETIKESCLDVAERMMNDEAGVHHQAFMARLAASIAHDRKTNIPEYLGYNGNSPVIPIAGRSVIRNNTIKYNGVDI